MKRFALLLLASIALSSFVAASVVDPASSSREAKGKGKVFLTMDEALKLAFPKCEIKKERIFLSEKEEKRAKELAEVNIGSGIVRPYRAYKNGKLVGTAYFDAHKVRTLKETLMVVVDTENRIQRIEVLAFGEPLDYIPSGKWYAQFKGRKLDQELRLKRGIRWITGATLTAQATTACARRVLALHQVIGERRPEPITTTKKPASESTGKPAKLVKGS